MKTARLCILLAGAALLATACSLAGLTRQVPEISPAQLNARLQGSEAAVVLDVRHGKEWRTAAFKIPGARHLEPRDMSDWVKTLPRDRTIVLYCD